MDQTPYNNKINFTLVGLLCLLILLLVGTINLSISKVVFKLPAFLNILIFGAIFLSILIKHEADKQKALFMAFIGISLLVMLSDLPFRNFSLLDGIENRFSTISVLFLLCLSAGVISFYLPSNTIKYIALALACVFSYRLLLSLNFKLIFSDDHPTFLFRLITLKESFPNVPSFNPLWNAGIEFRDFFASGALAVFILFYPFIYIFDLPKTYNYILLLILFFLPLLASYITARMLNLNSKAHFLMAILMLTHGTVFYRWSLTFGTLGFLLAMQMLLPVIAIVYKLGSQQKINKLEIILYVFCVSIMLLWPISVLFTAPLIIYVLLNLKNFIFKKEAWIVLVSLIFINLPWMIIFKEASKVESFVSAEHSKAEKAEQQTPINEAIPSIKKIRDYSQIKNSLKPLRDNLHSLNFCILFLGLVGIALINNRKLKLLFSLCFLWLLFLGCLGNSIWPQLELDRFILVGTYILCLPAAISVLFLFDNFRELGLKSIYIRSTIVLMLTISALSTYRVLGNQTKIPFYYKEEIVENLSSAINKYTKEGRGMFAGFTLHELSNGHIAPLVYFADTPLVARSYKHDHWGYFDVIPPRFRRRKGQRIEEFLDIYNITAIITHDKNWREYFKRHEKLYTEVWQEGRFKIFVRLNAVNNYFLEGSGEILQQRADRIKFKLNTDQAILKFNFLPYLEADKCEIYPHHVEGAIELIGLKNCPTDKEIVLRSNGALYRLLVLNSLFAIKD
mgnify:CR=1 FL=1